MQKQMKMFGSVDQLLGMLPGIKINKDDRQKLSHESDKQLKKMEVFIQSMTPAERANPDLINTSRKKRIAKGCGMGLAEINQFIKQFEQMRMMMKGMSDLKNMMGKMGANGFNPSSKMGKHAVNKALKMMRRFK